MITKAVTRVRNVAGVLLKEWRHYERALVANDGSYLALCNRDEKLEAAPTGLGFRCDWQWTSDLHAPKVLPGLGQRLMERALLDHPIVRSSAPESRGAPPELSFIIGHRGLDRLPHLVATLESIAGQQGPSVECIVVEQDMLPRLAGRLPAWVRHVHTPPPNALMPYCRSWAFNIGAKHARSPVMVLHDNDMMVPADYCAEVLKLISAGADVVNLKRFIFYLSELHTRRIFSGEAGLTDEPPLSVVQNLEGGGSIAITRRAYDAIGGLDESFIGWGGEDNEFWERAMTLKAWPYAALPLVHLWHTSQAGKHQVNNETLSHYHTLAAVPAERRSADLRGRASGEMSGPSGYAGKASQ